MGRDLLIATGAGLAFQLAMVIAGHFVPFVRDHVFAVGGVLISLVAGLVFARMARTGWPPSLVGGLIAGGLCALPAIGLSVALGDTMTMILLIGTGSSAVTGLVGAAVGKVLP